MKRASIVKEFFKSPLEVLRSEGEKVKSNPKKQLVFFLLAFVLSYLVLNLIISALPQMIFKESTGSAVQGLLSIQGINTTSVGTVECTEGNWISDLVSSQCYSFFAQGKTIIISWLCTGVLEIIILISAMIASFGVSWRKKAIGIIWAIVLGVIFNLLRIVVTINLLLGSDLGTVELAHDLLFRIILFVYIVVVYLVWFNWAAKGDLKGTHKVNLFKK